MADARELKLATWNIHKAVGTDGRRDPDRVLRVLHELDADIVALQEVDRRLGRRAAVLPRAAIEELGWQVASHPLRADSMGWHGNALLVRRGIAVRGVEPVHLPTIEPRGAVVAALEVGGSAVAVAGMHLDLSGIRRRHQLAAVLAALARHHGHAAQVALGDFNEWSRRGGCVAEFTSGWQALAPGLTYPSRRPLAPLDRIALSAHWRVVGRGVHHSALASAASDHLPAWVTATIHA